MKKSTNNEKGVVLLAVVVAVSVALMVGVSVSTRTLSMSSRVSRTDTASRLIATVEGGMERMLMSNECLLQEMSEGNYSTPCETLDMELGDDGKGGSACVVRFDPYTTKNDEIETLARITVEEFSYTSEDPDLYQFNLDGGQMKEVVLGDGVNDYTGDSINVCWYYGQVAMYYVAYNDDGGIDRGGYVSDKLADSITLVEGFETVASTNFTDEDDIVHDQWCAEVDLKNLRDAGNLRGLRIKSLYNGRTESNDGGIPVTYRVFPVPGASLPSQGYRVKVVGELARGSEEKSIRTLVGYRSYSYIPDVFDYNIYSTEEIQ